ncbi:fumarylacetoacetate hydrolase family protein [Paradesulfitobacterium ferrireducens]|uniref:fumarylacetoacetate hydrolase family protein n=1 Tax=Paradesulfitobacterium ferrireducens TaxID=2816476 RepID=UPI001A8FB71E|nr:fumarylacetoacetate hydrolase family protein [Paradesulfitobacterium ferrireducens]
MKLATIYRNQDLVLGIKTEKGILDIREAGRLLGQDVPVRIEQVLQSPQEQLQALGLLVKNAELSSGHGDSRLWLREDEVEFAPCVTNPEKILCVGLNYRKHAEETKHPIPATPVLFSKFANALSGHRETVSLPSEAREFDYEVELVIVIGKEGKNVPEEDALSYVFGYTAGNDLSVRDLQMRTSQWLLGKTCDGFAPLGPYLVTADEIPNPNLLALESRVNGEKRQSSNTKDMIFNCAALISYISKYMTLKPGDLIFTGTPEGVVHGYPKDRQVWLKSGDEVIVSIERIGELKTILK